MKKYTSQLLSISTFLLIGVICFNCAGEKNVQFTPDIPEDIPAEIILEPPKEVIESIPSWYLNPISKEGFRYQIATSVNTESKTAIENAEYYASQYLANTLQSEIIIELNNALVQVGKKENSFIGKKLKKSANKIISRHIDNYTIVNQEIQEESTDIGNIYRAYIIIEWDTGPAQVELLDKMKEHDIVYSMMKSTDLLRKIETNVAEYVSRKTPIYNEEESTEQLEKTNTDTNKITLEKERSTSSENNIIACAKNCKKIPWWRFWTKKTKCSCKDIISIESNN